MKLKQGLRPDIRSQIAALGIIDYSTLINTCRVVEDCLKAVELDRQQRSQGKRRLEGPRFQRPSLRPRGGVEKGKQVQSMPDTRKLLWSKCGKLHGGRPCR